MAGGSGVITILFTDLVDSTATEERVGSNRWDDVRRVHFDSLRTALAETGGEEVKTAGDSIMAVFDSVVAAFECAGMMQRATARDNRRHADSPVGLRIGISAGEAVRDDGDWYGIPVTEASRLCAAARGGEVVVADVARQLARGRGAHRLASPRELELKGISEPVTAWTLEWDDAVAGALPLPTRLERNAGSAFVGRAAERGQLDDVWADVTRDTRRVAFLAGEPGIGKTRLASEFARKVHGRGATVLFGRCQEGLQAPYMPFVEALRDFARACQPARLIALAKAADPRLARILPEVAPMVAAEDPATGDPETERYYLFEAVDAFITALAGEAPVVLVLDDLHWADASTLQLVRHLATSPAPAPLLLLATYRETDLSRSHPLSAALADLRRDGSSRRVSLRGLDHEDLTEMVRAWGITLDTRAFADAVHDETDGNPFFVEEVLRHLEETGSVERTDGGLRPTRPLAELGIPEGVREVIGRRLGRLPENADEVLAIAAVVGRDFPLSVVAACTRLATDEVVDVLDAAIAGGLVAEVEDRAGTYTFGHALVRQVLYEELTTTRRALLHWRVGEAIEQQQRGDASIDDLAYHFTEGAIAGDAEKAVAKALDAARRSWAQQAFEQAQAHIERAMATLDQIHIDEPTASALRLDALFVRGNVELALCKFATAWETGLAAADLALQTQDQVRILDACTILTGVLRGFPSAQALRIAEAARALLQSAPRELAIAIDLMVAFLRFELDGRAVTMQRIEESLAEARSLDDPFSVGLAMLSAATVRRGSPTEREVPGMNVDVYDTPNRLIIPGYRLVFHGATAMALADRARLDDLCAEASQQATRVGGLAAMTLATWNSAEAAARGRWRDAADAMQSALAFAEELPSNTSGRAFVIAANYLDQGRGLELIEGLSATDFRTRYEAHTAGVMAVAALAEAERLDEARIELDRLLRAAGGVDGLTDGVMQPFWVRWLPEVALRLRDLALGQELYAVAAPYSGLLLVSTWGQHWEGAADRAIGQLAALLGRPDEARERYAAAIELEQRMRAPALVTRTEYWLARLLVDSGDEAGRVLAGSVHTRAVDMGMRTVARDAERLLQ